MASPGTGMLFDSAVSATINSFTPYTVPSGKVLVAQLANISASPLAGNHDIGGMVMRFQGAQVINVVLGSGATISNTSIPDNGLVTMSGVLYINP